MYVSNEREMAICRKVPQGLLSEIVAISGDRWSCLFYTSHVPEDMQETDLRLFWISAGMGISSALIVPQLETSCFQVGLELPTYIQLYFKMLATNN